MQDVVPRQALFVGCVRLAVVLALFAFGISGCRPQAAPKKEVDKADKSKEQANARTQRNLQNAIESMRPEDLGISSAAERSIASLNEWAEAAKREVERAGEKWEPRQRHKLTNSLPKEWVERLSLDRFIERDASFLRDALWGTQAVRFASGDAEDDLERVVNIFAYVVRNVELNSKPRSVPLGIFDVMLLGRGSAEDRAWIFSELLRQQQIDSVVLTSGDADADDRWLLVGVLFDKSIYLFDPSLGLPVPSDTAQPRFAFPKVPATLQQAIDDPNVLASLGRDAETYPVTARKLKAAQVELICNTQLLSSRMRLLQRELTGDYSAIVSDPLEDFEDASGLWARVAKHPAATWEPDDVVIWGFPERQLEGASRLNSDQQIELTKLMFGLGAPRRVTHIESDASSKAASLKFGRPERAMLKFRMKQLLGHWPEALQGYLVAQLYDVDPPTSSELPTVTANEKRLLRGFIPREIRQLHTQAGDDACYWLAVCQFEQNRAKATVEQTLSYLDRHSSGAWVNPARVLLATTLAKQQRWKDAIRILNDVDEDSPSLPTAKVFMARWKRLMEAGE